MRLYPNHAPSIMDLVLALPEDIRHLTKCNVTICEILRDCSELAEKAGGDLCWNGCERGGVGRSISASHHLYEETCVFITQVSSPLFILRAAKPNPRRGIAQIGTGTRHGAELRSQHGR